MAGHSTNAEFENALASERKDRAVAMLGLPELIAGIRVESLTPRRLERLRAFNNPYVCGGEKSEFHIHKFLWFVSSGFVPEFDEVKPKELEFLSSIANLDCDEADEGIEAYYERTFLDAPTRAAGTPYYSSSAGIYHALNTSYPSAGWTLERVLDTPLRVIYQLIKVADQAVGCTVVNRRSSPLIGKYLSEIEHFTVATFDEVDAAIESKRSSRSQPTGSHG